MTIYAIMTIEEQTKSGSRWQTVKTEKKEISREFYNNTVDPKAIRFFRRLGGVETVQKDYTERGFLPVRILSTSPDRQTRFIRTFDFGGI